MPVFSMVLQGSIAEDEVLDVSDCCLNLAGRGSIELFVLLYEAHEFCIPP